MAHYYFDSRDGDEFIRDRVGVECDGIESACDEAARGLVDMAKDAVPGALRRELVIEVRDDADHQVIRAGLWFEVALLTG